VADTGAPWLLPYPLSSDLVRDGADAIKDLAEAVATGLDEAGNAGIGSNVVQTVKTDVFSASVGQGTLTSDVTGLTATITPTSATAKVMVIASLSVASQSSDVFATLFRDSSASDYRGDADGSRQRVSTSAMTLGSNERGVYSLTFTFLDSPGVATATTYSIRLSHNETASNTIYVNRSGFNDNTSRSAIAASSITLIEVAV
jgi:hypothetical protein